MNVSLGIRPASIPGMGSASGAPATGGGLAEALAGAINQVEAGQQGAKSAAMELLVGGKGDVHRVALASQRAELSLELFQQVRNKFVQAYQEIMKMPM